MYSLDCIKIINNLKKYQEAIECYDKAISINPNNDNAWNNKGNQCDKFLLFRLYIMYSLDCIKIINNLKKYQEAIECYDKAISINPKYDAAWNNKGFSLVLSNSNFLLHSLKKYLDAITCYDQALSICINPVRLKNKADSLMQLIRIFKIFELQLKQEAKKFYLDALRQGSNDKEYINRQLAKL